MSTPLILDSDSHELDDINAKLIKDGIKTSISDEHKLRHIWRAYVRSEGSLKSSLDSLEDLRKQHAQEMVEVENYVAHIRQLSDEREQLTLDFESENEQLKEEIERLKVSKDGGNIYSREICDMMAESGFSQMASDSNTVKEQVNYLLQRRLELMGKVKRLESEVEGLRKNASQGEGRDKLMKAMEEERKEMEDEIRRIQENHKNVKQAEKRAHEQELAALEQEQEKQRKDYEKRVKDFQNEVAQLKMRLDSEQKRHEEDMALVLKRHEGQMSRLLEEQNVEREKSNTSQTRTDQVMSEMAGIKVKMRAIEEEKNQLQYTVKALEEEIQREKEDLNLSKTHQESAVQDLVSELAIVKQGLRETEAKLKRCEEEKKTIESRLEVVHKDLETTREREAKVSTEKFSFQTKSQSMGEEVDKLKMQIQTDQDTIARQAKQIESLTIQLAEIQQKLDQTETKEKQLGHEVYALDAELKRMSSENKQNLNEYNQSLQQYEKLLSISKTENEELQSRLGEETHKNKTAESDVESLKAQVVDLRKDLEATLSASVSRERETMEQINTIQAERDELAKQLNEYKNRETEKLNHLQGESGRVKLLEGEKASLQSIVLSQEKTVGELSNKLDIHEKKIVELENSLARERDRNQDLLSRLDLTGQSFEGAKGDVSSMRDEIKVLTTQLLKQHDASVESQARYDLLVNELRGELDRTRDNFSNERHALAAQLDEALKDNRDVSILLRQREEELKALRNELTSASQSGTKASTALEFENKMRESLENRNAQLDRELQDAWAQIKKLLEKNSGLEVGKTEQEKEMDKVKQQLRNTESTLQKRYADHTAIVVARDTANQRADVAERELKTLHDQLKELRNQLDQAQHEIKLLSSQRSELQSRQQLVDNLSSQLREEEGNRSLQEQTIKELQHQVGLLRDRENKAQEKMGELREKLDVYKEKHKKSSEQHKQSENTARTLSDRTSGLQQENESIQMELVAAADRVDFLQRKCEERKVKAQAKLEAQRERHMKEKRHLESTIQSLQNSVALYQQRLEKEEEWKGTTESLHKNLLQDKKELLTKLTSSEEMIRSNLRGLREADNRLLLMEKENAILQEKNGTLMKEKMRLEKLTRELEKSVNSSSSLTNQGLLDVRNLVNALSRLRQHDGLNTMDRSYGSPSPDNMYSPQHSPRRQQVTSPLSHTGRYSPDRMGQINGHALEVPDADGRHSPSYLGTYSPSSRIGTSPRVPVAY